MRTCCGLTLHESVLISGICLLVADTAFFIINIGNIWTRELRAPLVESMRSIGPTDPEDVVNAFVDHPYIWNWVLTANLLAVGLETVLLIATVLRRATLLKIYLLFSLVNIVHTLSVVLPVIIINFTNGAIANYIRQQKQVLDNDNIGVERRRTFEGLVLDWNLAHIFALTSIVVMILSNVYVWVLTNSYRQDDSLTIKTNVKNLDLEAIIQELRNVQMAQNINEDSRRPQDGGRPFPVLPALNTRIEDRSW